MVGSENFEGGGRVLVIPDLLAIRISLLVMMTCNETEGKIILLMSSIQPVVPVPK